MSYFEFTTNDTWIVPDGIDKIDVCLIGGGGGGSQVLNYRSCGGGSGYVKSYYNIPVSKDDEITIEVGSGGDGAASSLSAAESYGVDGGESKIILPDNTEFVAEGGKGGYTKIENQVIVIAKGGDGGSGGGGGDLGNKANAGGDGGWNGSDGDSPASNPDGGGKGQGCSTVPFNQRYNDSISKWETINEGLTLLAMAGGGGGRFKSGGLWGGGDDQKSGIDKTGGGGGASGSTSIRGGNGIVIIRVSPSVGIGGLPLWLPNKRGNKQ